MYKHIKQLSLKTEHYVNHQHLLCRLKNQLSVLQSRFTVPWYCQAVLFSYLSECVFTVSIQIYQRNAEDKWKSCLLLKVQTMDSDCLITFFLNSSVVNIQHHTCFRLTNHCQFPPLKLQVIIVPTFQRTTMGTELLLYTR